MAIILVLFLYSENKRNIDENKQAVFALAKNTNPKLEDRPCTFDTNSGYEQHKQMCHIFSYPKPHHNTLSGRRFLKSIQSVKRKHNIL